MRRDQGRGPVGAIYIEGRKKKKKKSDRTRFLVQAYVMGGNGPEAVKPVL